MKRLFGLLLFVCILLSGCSWLDASYHFAVPHEHSGGGGETMNSASNYLQLRTVLEEMVSAGLESSVISLEDFPEEKVRDSMELAIRYIQSTYPIGAYAVESISYELGSVTGDRAMAVEIDYRHERREIQSIVTVSDMEQAEVLIGNALSKYEPGIVLLVEYYQVADVHQLVEDFAQTNPGEVMELPELTVSMYPDMGRRRVVELKFSYQSSRDSLRSMQEEVRRVFSAADLYVTHDAEDERKLSQLYAFLMERFDEYQIKTSITPAYSLLNHGVGDSNAVAVVYAAMCRQVDLECRVVVGTRSGEPWSWNIVCRDGYYYHVDLYDCQKQGSFRLLTDEQMADYVWDYSAYPACEGEPAPVNPGTGTVPEGSEPTQPPEGTVPIEPTEPPTEPSGPTEPTGPEDTEPTQPTEPPTEPPTLESTEPTETDRKNNLKKVKIGA